MKRIEWMELTGAGVAGAANYAITSGKVTFIPATVKDPDLWFAGGVIAADAFFGDRLHGEFGDALEGAATYQAGYLVNELLKKHSGTTTAAFADYSVGTAADPVAPVAGFTAGLYGDTEGFHAE